MRRVQAHSLDWTVMSRLQSITRRTLAAAAVGCALAGPSIGTAVLSSVNVGAVLSGPSWNGPKMQTLGGPSWNLPSKLSSSPDGPSWNGPAL